MPTPFLVGYDQYLHLPILDDRGTDDMSQHPSYFLIQLIEINKMLKYQLQPMNQ